MRSIINISLPQETARITKLRAKRAGFNSVSEYIRYLLKIDDDLIGEDELLQMSSRADKEYRSGALYKHGILTRIVKKNK